MGSLGLCDYLNTRGAEAMIFNAALCGEGEYLQRLCETVRRIQPEMIGLLIHWKEFLQSSLTIGEELRRSFPQIPIVAGGLTAGYLGRELLERFGFIDYLISADPEKPLEMLLAGKYPESVPNLTFRRDGEVVSNDVSWLIDQETIDTISFARLDSMIDWQRYVQAVRPIFGIPVFIGRGCAFDCPYCGGSRSAFRRHSNRKKIVYRSHEAILADLKRLREFTDTIYLCWECSPKFIRELFSRIAGDPDLKQHFFLNYGAWQMINEQFLDLYAAAFRFDPRKQSILELSPETSIDGDRKIVRDPALYFSNDRMFEMVRKVDERLGSSVRIEIYYSRYHKTHTSREKLIDELEGIHDFRERLYAAGLKNAFFTFFHLSTDVASEYWDLARGTDCSTGNLDFLTRGLERQSHGGIEDQEKANLCLYAPETFDKSERFIYDQAVFWNGLLFKNLPDYSFIFTRLVGFRSCFALLTGAAREWYEGEEWGRFQAVTVQTVFTLLEGRFRTIEAGTYSRNPSLFDDLFTLYGKFLNATTSQTNRDRPDLKEKPVLNRDRMVVTGYNFTAREFYRSLGTGVDGAALDEIPAVETTLNMIIPGRIHSFDERYLPEFERFDGRSTFPQIMQQIGRDGSLNTREIIDLVAFLTRHHGYFTFQR